MVSGTANLAIVISCVLFMALLSVVVFWNTRKRAEKEAQNRAQSSFARSLTDVEPPPAYIKESHHPTGIALPSYGSHYAHHGHDSHAGSSHPIHGQASAQQVPTANRVTMLPP